MHLSDLRFRFFYSVPHMWGIDESSCKSRRVNSYESMVQLVLQEGQVVTGVQAAFNRRYYDREWSYTVCNIAQECNQIESISFVTDEKVNSSMLVLCLFYLF